MRDDCNVRRSMPRANGSDTSGENKSTASATAGCRRLPDDLVGEVLRRAPARSLARFRCVCLSWNELISSDGFLERYLKEEHGPPKLVLAPLAKRHAVSKFDHALCTDCPRIVGARPCRGLVLLCRPCAAATYSVCNPSTGGLLHLQPCRGKSYMSIAGIGFHAPTKEYKVVQLLRPGRLRTTKWRCRVLTVGDPGGWRQPLVQLSSSIMRFMQRYDSLTDVVDPVFANGRLHWMLSIEYLTADDPQGILAFSFGEESFATVPLPPFATTDVVMGNHPSLSDIRKEHIRWSWSSELNSGISTPAGTVLVELDGCLCMIRDLRRRAGLNDDLFEIWKLKDYESGAWSLDYRINLAPHVAGPLIKPWLVLPLCYLDGGGGGGRDNRKVLLTTTAHDAHVYDPDRKTLQTVSTSMSMTYCDSTREKLVSSPTLMRLALYQESPVRIAGMEQDQDTIGYSVIPLKAVTHTESVIGSPS